MSLELTLNEKITLLVILDSRIEKLEKLIEFSKNDDDKYLSKSYTQDVQNLLKLKYKIKEYDTWKTI